MMAPSYLRSSLCNFPPVREPLSFSSSSQIMLQGAGSRKLHI